MERVFPLVRVTGTSFEMGRQHGIEAAPRVEAYLRLIEKLTGRGRGELAEAALRFEPLMARDYLDEVRGLAAGAGIPYAEALLCQVRTEAARIMDGACTAFALRGSATADGRTLAGQNSDVEPEFEDCAIVLHVEPTDGRPRAVMLTWAGQLGYAGMNQHGVANFANALYNFTWREGLPHYPLKRLLLEQRTAADCVALLGRHRLCSAGNIVLCDGAGNIADVEVRPEAAAIYRSGQEDCIVHTNHYLTPEFAAQEDGHLPDSPARYLRALALIQADWGRLTVDHLRRLLADHEGAPAGICRHGSAGIHSVVGYIADPAAGLFHVRRGYGCTGTWTSYAV